MDSPLKERITSKAAGDQTSQFGRTPASEGDAQARKRCAESRLADVMSGWTMFEVTFLTSAVRARDRWPQGRSWLRVLTVGSSQLSFFALIFAALYVPFTPRCRIHFTG